MAFRNSFAARSGLSLTRTPNHREQVVRRRLGVIGAMVGLAVLSGLVGAIAQPRPAEGPFGPFSHFPSE